jgi:hypothetical protein
MTSPRSCTTSAADLTGARDHGIAEVQAGDEVPRSHNCLSRLGERLSAPLPKSEVMDDAKTVAQEIVQSLTSCSTCVG